MENQAEFYIKLLRDVLSADKQVRQQAEAHLKELEARPDFIEKLTQITTGQQLAPEIRISAAIYLKNKITHIWLGGDVSVRQDSVRKSLCDAIHKTHDDRHLVKQLSEALYKTLVVDDWPELCDIAAKFLSSSNFGDVYTGLLLGFQLVKSKRWSRAQDAGPLNQYVTKLFPLLTALAQNFVQHLGADEQAPAEALYLILKIFKYATYMELPQYFSDPQNLGKWIEIQLAVISSPLPQYLERMDEDARARHHSVKAVKWSYANIQRLQYKYGGGSSSSSKETDAAFVNYFNSHFVPVILDTYWKEIAAWSSKEKWLGESALYHMIAFLEACSTSIDATWSLIAAKLDAIFNHLVMPSLSATDASLELFEDDPEEYYRRYLDINKEVKTADVAAINFVFSLCFKRFPEVIESILVLLNDTFTKRAADLSDLDHAKRAEAGLRLLSSISFKIVKKTSPVAHQIDQMIDSFVVPELADSNKHGFTKARACDVIASFAYTYRDKAVLARVYQGCMACFESSGSLPLQITSADALGTLIVEPDVEHALAPHVTQVVEKLLQLSNNYEFDAINSIMDDFVEKFALQLEPFSVQIAGNLNQQLVKICSELLDAGNLETSTDDVDKEYQGIGILNTMMTMLLSMNSSKQITVRLFQEMAPSIKFILDNALVNFVNEAMELLESCNVTLKEISPLMWEFFEATLDSFETYGEDFYEVYVPFLESCINYGFRTKTASDPHFIQLMNVIVKNVSKSKEESYFELSTLELSFELLYKAVLTVHGFEATLPQVLRLATSAYLESDPDEQAALLKPYLKILLSAFCKYPEVSLEPFTDDESVQLFQLWFNSDHSFTTAFDLKLQIMAVISVLKWVYSGRPGLAPQIADAESGLKVKLITCLERLPGVVQKQAELLSHQSTRHAKDVDDYENGDDYFNDQPDDYEYDAEEVDLYKDILFDSLNVYDEFVNGFLKSGNGDVYNRFVDGIADPNMVNVVNQCIASVQ